MISRTAVNYTIDFLAAWIVENPTEIFGRDLGRNVFDVLAAIALDRLHNILRECMQEAKRVDSGVAALIKYARDVRQIGKIQHTHIPYWLESPDR